MKDFVFIEYTPLLDGGVPSSVIHDLHAHPGFVEGWVYNVAKLESQPSCLLFVPLHAMKYVPSFVRKDRFARFNDPRAKR